MSRGIFISLEGGEGVGKSTQAHLLAEKLESMGHQTVLTREPGGTPGAEAIRSLLLDPTGEGWGREAEVLLFAAARADHIERLIRPALQAGKWVICDRFIDSTRAYQGGGGGMNDRDILDLHRIGCAGLLPDATLLIEVSPEESAQRLEKRDKGQSDRIGGRAAEYHSRVHAAFNVLASAEPKRFHRIDGMGEPQDIHQQIMVALSSVMRSA
ncbi:dTMP kinase [Altericroceibacterium spongiae]|uniref:Thymidylate kinase n=1 Tax=Altericroceibacterium spongiae TaxID=2320269 RepID=A0A420ERZ7_9SPHN|nr:dTMP kinase [Altericroceibacterium spongiae]RKF23400.1 dTMP kinase [Altericroceibacterium spongiae]